MSKSIITVSLNPSMDKTVTLNKLNVGGLNRISEFRLDAGGKGINVANILKTFQLDVTVAGFIAGDLGRTIQHSVEAKGIKTDFITVPGETRTNLKVVDLERRETTELNEAGFQVPEQDQKAFLDKIRNLPKQTESEVIILGGSLSPGIKKNYYAEIIEAVRPEGVKTILDADGEAFAAGLEAIPYAIKPNLFELEQFAGRKLETDQDILEEARRLLSKGISIVLVSMGGDGSIVADANEAYRLKPFPITVQSTVGAGDSMVAVMAYCLSTGKTLKELAVWSSAAGTITASKPGTQVCTFDEIINAADLVNIEKL